MIKSSLIRQFGNPHGTLGLVAGRIMATRASNVERNLWIAEVLAPEPDAKILEIGHGPGIAIAQIWPQLTTGHIVGIDVSELMSKSAGKRNQDGVDRGVVEFRTGDAQHLPPDLQDLDVIYGVNVSMFWSDPRATISQLTKRLRPGGAITLAYMTPPTADRPAQSMAEELSAHFDATGLVRITTATFDFDPPAIAVTGHRAD
ncbi:MAG: methyltransferase domain-containing protein [Actinobacteria bacterium]|nr:methyltransferase domain-containing protein [Actinomycetota bacterium]